VIRRDGAIRWVELNTSIIEWEGRPATLNMVRDITDRKKIEEALSHANQKLNLLSSITRHDVMNQLMVLRGYLDLSREHLGDGEAMQRYIDNEMSGVRLIERQILFTKDYQDMGVKSPVWQDLDMVLVRARGSLPLGNIVIEQQHTDVQIFADPLLEKVFFNLIDNALRHGGEKMTRIRVSTHETDAGLSIVIEDDGAGIPPEYRTSLFSRGIGNNTGFGLFLAKEILSITNIAITETSEQGKGARFEVLVPKGAYRFD
jgi:signal transduction histidine kinase